MTADPDNLTITFDSLEEAEAVLEQLVKRWEGCLILRNDPAGELVATVNELVEKARS